MIAANTLVSRTDLLGELLAYMIFMVVIGGIGTFEDRSSARCSSASCKRVVGSRRLVSRNPGLGSDHLHRVPPAGCGG
jgi:hypothetical protein